MNEEFNHIGTGDQGQGTGVVVPPAVLPPAALPPTVLSPRATALTFHNPDNRKN
ncbi:MAG: hypothetical protein LBU85_04885 [Treponema sp.]|nr:hypothetical protein [Treponema sp.]